MQRRSQNILVGAPPFTSQEGLSPSMYGTWKMHWRQQSGGSLSLRRMPVRGRADPQIKHSSLRTPFLGYGNFRRGKNRPDWTEDNATPEDEDGEDTVVQDVKLEKRYSPKTAATINLLDERQILYDLILRLLECVCFDDSLLRRHSTAILIFMPGMGEIRRMNDMLTEHRRFGSEDEFVIHALHSTVSSENQGAVFDLPRKGIRKIVIGMASLQESLFMDTDPQRKRPILRKLVSPFRILPASLIRANTAR
jgi:hypothetical protein